MGKHNVEVKQLISLGGGVFINVDGEKQGHIGVRGNSYGHLTYLMKSKNDWCIVVFENEEWAKEQLPDIEKWYSEVWKLEEDQLVQIFGAKQA